MNELATANLSGSSGSKPAPERRVRHGLIEDWRDALGILVLLLVAAFSGALIARYWPGGDEDATRQAGDLGARMTSIEERLSAGRATPEILALKTRVAKLETRLRNTELAMSAGDFAGNLAAAGTPAPGPDAARKLLDDMATRLGSLEGKSATAADLQAAKDALAALTTRIETLGQRLARVENSDLLTLAHRASLATAVANLTRASQGSSPFKTEYDAVAALYPGDVAVDEIAPIAARGIPTVGTLIATFGNAADDAMDAERVAAGKDTWTRLSANFMSLISSRAVGETAGTSTESRLARAELRLKAGDLNAAVKELSAIKGAARAPLTPWLSQAKARVKLEATLAALNTRAAAALAGPISTDDPSNPIPQMPAP